MPHITARDGTRLYYEEAGHGTAVIFVHEYAADYRTWEPQMRRFSRSYRCITYSQRGYPPSDIPNEPEKYTQDCFRDDVIALMDALKIDKAHIVGHSMGGLIAIRYAQRFGATLSGLVLSAPAAGLAPFLEMVLSAPEIPEQGFDGSLLSRDPAVGEVNAADPLVYHGPWARATLEAALAANQACALALAAHTVVGQRHLQRRVHRLGAGVGEEQLGHPGRRQLHRLFRQLECLGVGHLERRREVHLGRLLLDGLDDPGPRMSGVHAPETGHAIEDLPPIVRPVVHAAGSRQQARRLLELPVGSERHPIGVELHPGLLVSGGRWQTAHGQTVRAIVPAPSCSRSAPQA